LSGPDRYMRKPKNGMLRKARGLLNRSAALLFTLFLLGLWQAIAVLAHVPELILPTPLAIARRLVTDHRVLLGDSAVTLSEIVTGFGAATLIGVPLALAIFYSRFVGRILYPLLIAFQTVPKVALAPLLVLWFGFGFMPKILIGFLTAFFPIVISTVVGLQALEAEMVKMLKSMGASEWQIFWKLRLPTALPNLFGGLKIGIGLAVIGSIIGEYVAAESGLGYRQITANAQFDSSLNFAALVAISLLGVVTFYIVDFVERLFMRFR
jgi:NitT/TauT family transport system permease protein